MMGPTDPMIHPSSCLKERVSAREKCRNWHALALVTGFEPGDSSKPEARL